MTAGGSHTCAVPQGFWKCWGNNFHGQLGRGPFHGIGEGAFETTPQMVFGPFGSGTLTSLTISAGDQHTCGTANVGGDRQLLCWGFNNLGQVGNTGGALDVVSPTRVKSPTGFVPVGVAASSQHSCGLFVCSGVEHRAFCWGNNFQGKLGLGHDLPGGHSEPTLSAIDNTAALVSSPNSCHTCSLARDGKMHCWGCNESGQLGDGTTTDRFSATKPLGIETGILQIAVGGGHTCAWTVAGPRAFCWGKNNDGQLGVQDFANHSTATAVAGF